MLLNETLYSHPVVTSTHYKTYGTARCAKEAANNYIFLRKKSNVSSDRYIIDNLNCPFQNS